MKVQGMQSGGPQSVQESRGSNPHFHSFTRSGGQSMTGQQSAYQSTVAHHGSYHLPEYWQSTGHVYSTKPLYPSRGITFYQCTTRCLWLPGHKGSRRLLLVLTSVRTLIYLVLLTMVGIISAVSEL